MISTILRTLLIVLLILTPEIRTSSLDGERLVESSDQKYVEYFESSPTSTTAVFMNNSPIYARDKRLVSIFNPHRAQNLQYLSAELLINIGEYLEFPHRDLGGLNRYMGRVFATLTPSHVISNQIGIQELLRLPKCPDLKYLIGGILNEKSLMVEEAFLMIIIDVALLKSLPNIKGPLIRFLYSKLKENPSISRENLLKTIHPFKAKHSPISALLQAALELKDFEIVFDIWENFPETRPRNGESFLITKKVIRAAIEAGKISDLLQIYAQKFSMQEFFNLTSKILSQTIDPLVLEMFLKVAFRPSDRFTANYSGTFLNAWIYALTQSSERGHHQEGMMGEYLNELAGLVEARVDDENNSHVGVRKQTLLLLIAIRTGRAGDLTTMFNHLTSFPTLRFQTHHEIILWSLVVEERYPEFFNLLTRLRLRIIKSSWLRVIISKSGSSEFITELISNHNTQRLFSSNLYGEAYFNKQLFFHLSGFRDENYYLSSSSLNEQLFDYLVVHLGPREEEWEAFFRKRSHWTASNFAKLISHLLKHLRQHPNIFNLIRQLLVDQVIGIVPWGRPEVYLTFDEVEFVLSDGEIVALVKILNRHMQFRSDPSVSLIASRLLSVIRFNMSDLLLRMPFYDQNPRLTNIEIALKSTLKQLKDLNSHLTDQEQLDSSLIYHFNPILSKLSAVDYLYALPYSLLRSVIANDPGRVMKALRTFTLNQELKLCAVLSSIRAETVKVKGPQVITSDMERLLRTFQINLEIV